MQGALVVGGSFHGVEGADPGRCVHLHLVTASAEDAQVTDEVGDEAFLLGGDDDAVHAALGKQGRQGGGQGAEFTLCETDPLERGARFQEGVPDADGGSRAAGHFLGNEDDAVRPSEALGRPGGQVFILAGGGGRDLDEVPVGVAERGGTLVQG